MSVTFPRRTLDELVDRPQPAERPEVLAAATAIVNDVRLRGEAAVREYVARFDGREPESPLVVGRSELQSAFDALGPDERQRLTRIADRIRCFAEGQRRSLAPFERTIPGGAAGHTIVPVERAGCYAPGGRYPLPSSVLMTALTARVAGVS